MPLRAPVWILAAALMRAADWPQFLGPSRDGVYTGTDLARSWPAAGPPVVWKKRVGQGFAGPAVAEGRLILFHRLADKEIVDCLDAVTGERKWTFESPASYRDDFGFDEGPRATPVISAGRVHTFGAEGVLHALDFATGRMLWRVDTAREFRTAKGSFGAASSPLADNGRVLLNVGGSAGVAAFDAASGKLLWTATRDEASYSAPVAATLGGRRVALVFARSGLWILEPASGQVIAQHRWRSRSQASVNVATPIVMGSCIFLSASYGTGAVLLDFQGGAFKTAWSSDEVLSNHYATSVRRDGHLYGYHGRQEESPSLRAVEWSSGKVAWSVERYGAGTLTLAGDRLVIVRENGEVVLAEAAPRSYQVVSKARLLTGTVRAYPALAEGRLYVRNENTLVAADLRP